MDWNVDAYLLFCIIQFIISFTKDNFYVYSNTLQFHKKSTISEATISFWFNVKLCFLATSGERRIQKNVQVLIIAPKLGFAPGISRDGNSRVFPTFFQSRIPGKTLREPGKYGVHYFHKTDRKIWCFGNETTISMCLQDYLVQGRGWIL